MPKKGGIAMNVRDLVPWTRDSDRDRTLPDPASQRGSIFTLHREVDRLFDDVLRGIDSPSPWGARALWPHVEIEDGATEYRVTADLPGLDENNVEVEIHEGVLVLRGEKRVENEDRARAYSERAYGRFERRIALDGADEANVQATFRNGVLAITVPKSNQTRERIKRIPINQPGLTH
jgi:HSP20 family protein